MQPRKIAATIIAGLMSAALVQGGFAQDAMTVDPATMNPEELVDARQAEMQENGATLGAAADLTGADAVAAADTLIANFTLLPTLFVEGSIVGDSRALPLIWEDKAAFEAIFAKAATAATEMKTAAEAGDATAYAAAVDAVGAVCGECHQTYRAAE